MTPAAPGNACPAAPVPIQLTDLARGASPLPRMLHGLGTRSILHFAARGASVAMEAALYGAGDRLVPPRGRLVEAAQGRATPGHGAVALYAHWSPRGRISAMVRRQVASWREAGFDVVFVTNASPPAADWDAIGEDAVLRLRRTNSGGDFGAWRDAAAEALGDRLPGELLLANDSMLGPFLPLTPLVAAWRAGGDGLFGMTESLAGGAHLQSYAVLARGDAPVGAVLAHLRGFHDSRSKWRIVQNGEIGLTRRLLAAEMRCAALIGYARVLGQVDAATRASLGRRFAAPGAFGRFPLNPCHHFWRVLLERMGFPFVKAALVCGNPWRLPGIEAWADILPAREVAMARDHLRIMRGS